MLAAINWHKSSLNVNAFLYSGSNLVPLISEVKMHLNCNCFYLFHIYPFLISSYLPFVRSILLALSPGFFLTCQTYFINYQLFLHLLSFHLSTIVAPKSTNTNLFQVHTLLTLSSCLLHKINLLQLRSTYACSSCHSFIHSSTS